MYKKRGSKLQKRVHWNEFPTWNVILYIRRGKNKAEGKYTRTQINDSAAFEFSAFNLLSLGRPKFRIAPSDTNAERSSHHLLIRRLFASLLLLIMYALQAHELIRSRDHENNEYLQWSTESRIQERWKYSEISNSIRKRDTESKQTETKSLENSELVKWRRELREVRACSDRTFTRKWVKMFRTSSIYICVIRMSVRLVCF